MYSQCPTLKCHFEVGIRTIFYEEKGLMDSRHFRRFKRNTIYHLFMESGYLAQVIYGRNLNNGPDESLILLISGLAQISSVESEQTILDSRPLKYVIRAACF